MTIVSVLADASRDAASEPARVCAEPGDASAQPAAESLPDPGFFEGAEKLLEISFTMSDLAAVGLPPIPAAGLRHVRRDQWAELLKVVHCDIVSALSNDAMDAYVLSESSLFVFPAKIILKTCGTTTLLDAVEPILALARTFGLTEVLHVFYSRKNFLEPSRQIHPHGCFEHEVHALDRRFPHGKAYTLGTINADHWCLYLAESPRQTAPVQRLLPLPASKPDHTLEILMHELDPEAMRPFYRGPAFISSRHASKVSGIADLMPNAALDELVFNPCGYSANGVLDDVYFTIHVTPQPYCSFASFETNVPMDKYTSLINRVAAIFRPRRFQVTLFASDASRCGQSCAGYDAAKITGFRRTDMVYHEFQHYDLTFAQFVRHL